MKKVMKGLLLQAYGILAAASMEKLDVAQRIEVVKILRKVRPQVEDIEGFLNDLREKNQGLKADKLAEMNRLTNEEMKAEVEIDVSLGDMLNRLMEGNGTWNAAQVMLLEDVFN